MTDKQKEAIERLNNFKTIKVLYGNTFAMHLEQLKQLQNDIETLLNLIQTQKAEIEHQKEKRENQKKELSILNEKQKEFNKLRNTVNSYKGQFKRQQVEIEKKDKIIDYMAKTINEAYFASGDFEVWFEDEICKVQRYEDYTYVEKDIKQYFERGTK